MRLVLWLGLAAASLACEKPQSVESDPTRSTEAGISLPRNPAVLALRLGVPVDSLLVAGQERYRSQVYDSARAIWHVELNRARSAGDAKAEARVRMWLGIVAWRLSDYKKAREEGEASVSLKRRLGMDDELSRSFNSLGLIAYNEGRYRDALVMYDSAIAAASRHEDAAGIARAASNVPLVNVELGRFEEAREDFRRALEANRIAEDERTQANLLANIGMLEVRLGNPRRAIMLLDSARRKYEAHDVSGHANALGQLATAWMAVGELQRALAALDTAIAIARSEGLQQEVAANLEVLADLQVQAGNPRLALATLRTADSIDANLGLIHERGTNLRRTAMILRELGELAPALKTSERAVLEHRRVNAFSEIIFDRLSIVEILLRTDNRKGAEAQLDSAEREANETGNPAVTNEVLLVAADLSLRTGDSRGALKKLSQVKTVAGAEDWRALDLRAAALQKLERLPDAMREARRALGLVERERASLGAGPLRSGYLANRNRSFSRMVEIQLALGDTAGAFRTAAFVPGRMLAERLSGLDFPGDRLGSIARNEKLLVRSEELERQLREARIAGESKELTTSLERELARTRTAYETAIASTARVPRSGILGEAVPAVRDIQAALSPRQALVLYLSGDDHLDIFVLRRNRVTHASSRVGARELSRKIRFARQSLQRSSGTRAAITALADLRDVLIAPVDAILGDASQLIVVPHSSIGALPFAALWDRRQGRFLIQQRAVSYVPTVAAIVEKSSVEPNQRMSVFSPDPVNLISTRKEAIDIARLSPRTERFIGAKSSKSAVRQALDRGDIVHIASHGSHNSQNPLFSRMVVGRNSRRGSDETLSVHEILALQVRSPLVFLSGCETALAGAGEGVFWSHSDEGSLAQALLFAGASAVIATLWPVRDSEAAAIATDFYRSVRSAPTSSDALAEAQRGAIRRGGGLGWAAYTISGTGGARTR